MTVTIPLSGIMFIFIGVAAVLGAVLCGCINDGCVPLGVFVLVIIVVLMCTGAYLCE